MQVAIFKINFKYTDTAMTNIKKYFIETIKHEMC